MTTPATPANRRPSITGEAPKLALRILPVCAAAFVLTIVFPGRFRFTGRLRGVAFAAGIEQAAAGLVFWIAAHPDAESNSSWAHLIQSLGDRACRLIVRFRSASPGDFSSVLGWGIVNQLGSASLDWRTIFQARTILPGDEISQLFFERCRHFIHHPPPAQCNGVVILKEKERAHLPSDLLRQ
jgi:hypothetical protein